MAARRLLSDARMRRTERLPFELYVTWHREGREIVCRAVDLNAHGMFVRTDEPIAPDSELQLAVQLPDRVLELIVAARFVGTTARGRGVGVERLVFDELADRHWLAFYEALYAEQARQRRSAAMGA